MTEVLQGKIGALEKEFKWMEAAKSYEKLLQSQHSSNAAKAEIVERIGFCYSRASTQATTKSRFKNLRLKASESYADAARLFEKANGSIGRCKGSRCDALAHYMKSWLPSDPEEKRKRLKSCISYVKKGLSACIKGENQSAYGRLILDMLTYLLESLYTAEDWKEQEIIGEEGAGLTEKALDVFTKTGQQDSILRTYFIAGHYSAYIANLLGDEETREMLIEKTLNYVDKALELCETTQRPYHSAMSRWAAAYSTLIFKGDVESAIEHATVMLKNSILTRDNYLIGVANYLLAFATNWMALREGDPDKRREGHEKAIEGAKEAIRRLELVSQDFYIAETYLFYAESYSNLSKITDASQEEKEALLEKAVNLGRKGLEHAKRSGSPDALGSTLHALSKALHSYSEWKTTNDERKKLVEEALIHRKRYNDIVNKAFHFESWPQGVGKYYEGVVKAELARVHTGGVNQEPLLKTAILDMEKGITMTERDIHANPEMLPRVAAVGNFEEQLGKVLNEYYEATGEESALKKEVNVYEKAAKNFLNANMPTRAAEVQWKIASRYEEIGNHQMAATHFMNAAEAYQSSAKKIPQLQEFYSEHARYMEAWYEIENARHSHTRLEFDEAKKNYERAADLHESTNTWKFLAPNYRAWAQLELAEDVSRSELSPEAIHNFQNAADLFSETERRLQLRLGKRRRQISTDNDEGRLITTLAQVSNSRKQYCIGRIYLEEARILDRQGEHASSSEKYELAASTFQEAASSGSSKMQEELKPIIILCQAWQKMMEAEAKESSSKFGEAAELFEQAKDYAIDEQTSLLALANCSYCKALKSGTAFANTRDTALYLAAIQHLENAANYYSRAEFTAASAYAKGTQRLFDAYVYMDTGKKEVDPNKRARYFLMAEKVLQISQRSFLEANHPEKSEQVKKLLETVKEERELATSLSEVLHAPSIASSTAGFITPTTREETAVGLEKFEKASVQASLKFQHEKGKMGEDFEIILQISNVGKEAVLLTRVKEFLPEGVSLVKAPSFCMAEDVNLGIKGKRLAPLETEEMALILRTFQEGVFNLRPQLVYLNERGQQMTSELDVASIRIEEVRLPSRISTGSQKLDSILLGGIPEHYSVILTSISCNERDQLVKRFMEVGVKEGQTTFYVSTKMGMEDLAEGFQSTFFLFLCNPQAALLKAPSNVIRLKGVDNLTSINIALTSTFRRLTQDEGPRRACIEIVSDVLLQHKIVNTRRWLNSLIPELKSKGFTTLAVMNPHMHSSEEVQGILGLFDGEITILEREGVDGPERVLKVEKLYNQQYLETELSPKKDQVFENNAG
ncbi:MAG: hypothetical protein JSV35_05120 [Candidatus Bathyarchaeota archaeon]|nr:MAG: hypothetical protein JSV35_05120 [Candidatus Bathyarchaeota archaeon]